MRRRVRPPTPKPGGGGLLGKSESDEAARSRPARFAAPPARDGNPCSFLGKYAGVPSLCFLIGASG